MKSKYSKHNQAEFTYRLFGGFVLLDVLETAILGKQRKTFRDGLDRCQPPPFSLIFLLKRCFVSEQFGDAGTVQPFLGFGILP